MENLPERSRISPNFRKHLSLFYLRVRFKHITYKETTAESNTS